MTGLVYFLYEFNDVRGEYQIDTKAYFLLVFPSVPLAMFLMRMDKVKQIIPHRTQRFAVVALVCSLPFICFYAGWQMSDLIYRNQRYTYVPSDHLPEKLKNISADKDIKYIGKIGSHIFLSPMDNSAVVVTSEEFMMPLVLMRYRNKQP